MQIENLTIEKAKPNRSSYSPNSAKQVQPILDRLMETGQDVYVNAQQTGYTANTLYVKFNDGFKFILDNFDEDKYSILRTKVAIRKTDDGIIIYFKETINNSLKSKAIDYEFNDSMTWKNDLETWYKTAKDTELFERNVSVSEADREFVYNLVNEDSEVDITDTSVRVMKWSTSTSYAHSDYSTLYSVQSAQFYQDLNDNRTTAGDFSRGIRGNAWLKVARTSSTLLKNLKTGRVRRTESTKENQRKDQTWLN